MGLQTRIDELTEKLRMERDVNESVSQHLRNKTDEINTMLKKRDELKD